MGNTTNTDVLCSNREGTRFVHIQVKTFVPGTKTCSVGLNAERAFGPGFFWVLAGIPAADIGAALYEIQQSFTSASTTLGFRVPYMPEGMAGADHFDTYWGNLSKSIDFTQAHPLQ
jgi:hypothetical protein